MKQRLIPLLALLCLLLSLTACGGDTPPADDTGSQAAAPMTEEDYQSQVDALSADINTSMSAMSALSTTDEESFREGIENVRAMAESFRTFAAINNPPEAWAEAHAKIAEGCTGFADSLDGLCDSAEQMLDGTMSTDDYNNAVAEHTTGLSEAAALLTEGFGMMES